MEDLVKKYISNEYTQKLLIKKLVGMSYAGSVVELLKVIENYDADKENYDYLLEEFRTYTK